MVMDVVGLECIVSHVNRVHNDPRMLPHSYLTKYAAFMVIRSLQLLLTRYVPDVLGTMRGSVTYLP